MTSIGTSLSIQQQLFVLLRRSLKRADSLKLKRLMASNRLAMAKFDLTVAVAERMVRSVKVFVERKTFSVRWEGEHGGTWCSITEHSRGSTFVLGFEKEAVGWMIEHLTKAIEMKSHLGFNRKFRGKRCAHLMEVSFNDHGRFIRISEFATKRKYSYLIIPEGEEGRGWENIKRVLSSMLVVPLSNAVEK